MPELTLTGLEVVLDVARLGSFTAAAEELGYTQSAISRQVSAVEAAVGGRVFERRARGVALTPVGEVLVRHAHRVRGQVEAARAEIAGLQDRVAGRLVVGAYPVAAATWVPRAIAALREAHPALVVDLREAGSPAQLRLLHSGRIEVALVAGGEGLPDHDLTGLHSERLGRGTFGVALSATHPLAGRAELDVADLAAEAWVVGSGEGPQFEAWPSLVDPHVAYRVQSWPTRLGLVAAGLAVCLMPGSAAAMAPAGVVWRPVRDPAPGPDRETLVVTAERRTPAAELFVRALREAAPASAASAP